MSETVEPLIQECEACGTLIDISEQEPLALMHCPTCGAAMRVRRAFGNFELLEVLGAGGMGAVYRAQDSALNRSVALKLLRREYSEHPDFIQQFEHEASLTALINHPNVVKVFSTGSSHGHFYIAMELVDKGSLDDLITLQGRVGEAQVLEVGIQAAEGLRAAYQRGLMHRDVKPGNILFADAHHAKIVDFGLAAPLGSDATTGGEVWGTPYYVAPEKLESPPVEDFRSDIYSLGATLFHAAAGRAPYEAEDASVVALKHLKSQPVNLQTFAPDVSSSTAYVVNRALHKDPNQRYQSYDELIQHLEYARTQLLNPGGAPVKAGKPGARVVAKAKPRVVMQSKGSQAAMSLITILMFAALFGGGYYLYKNWERFSPTKKKTVVKEDNAEKKAAERDFETRYRDLQAKLAAGEVEEAAEGFRALLVERPEGKQPQHTWIEFEAALATVMAGKMDDARPDFEKLANLKDYSPDPFAMKFTAFIRDLSRRMLDENVPSEDYIKDYNAQNYEAMGLLTLGAKAWEMAEFERGLKFFEEFSNAQPVANDAWVRQYFQIPGDYAASLKAYEGFMKEVEEVGGIDKPDLDLKKLKADLAGLKEKLATLKLRGQLAKKGRALVRKGELQVAEYESEQQKSLAEMEASDEGVLAEARTKAEALAVEFKFKEAEKVVKEAGVFTEKGKKAKINLRKRYEWLISFKSTLTQDLGAYGYPQGVRRNSGLPVMGNVQDADEQSLIVTVGSDKVPVPWVGPQGASYDGLVLIARTFLRPELPPDRFADRLWYLGVYSDMVGKTKEAGAYFAEAVKKKPAYADEWKLFPNVPRPAA